MSRILTVAKREYLENVRTKAFLIGVILTPLWMGLIFLIPMLVKDRGTTRESIVIADATDVLGDALERELEKRASASTSSAPTSKRCGTDLRRPRSFRICAARRGRANCTPSF